MWSFARTILSTLDCRSLSSNDERLTLSWTCCKGFFYGWNTLSLIHGHPAHSLSLDSACLFKFFIDLAIVVLWGGSLLYSILTFLCATIVDFSSANQSTQFTFTSVEAMDEIDSEKKKILFYLSKNCCKFCGEELFNNHT